MSEPQPCTLRELLAYFLRLGTFGFGGPIALAGHMHHDLVETRQWISEQDYRIPTAAIGLAALAALVWLRKIPEPVLILTAAIVGLLLRR